MVGWNNHLPPKECIKMTIIEFEKYKDAGTGNYTKLETNTDLELASALINVLTNRKKGYPREIRTFETFEDGSVHIVIDTHTTTKKDRTIGQVDPTLE